MENGREIGFFFEIKEIVMLVFSEIAEIISKLLLSLLVLLMTS